MIISGGGFGSQRAPGRSEPFSGLSGGDPERDVSRRSKRETSINIRTCERVDPKKEKKKKGNNNKNKPPDTSEEKI